MYGPIAISHRYSGRSASHGAAVAVLWATSMALAVTVFAGRPADGAAVFWAVPILLSIIAGVFARRAWARAMHGTLAWDGEAWFWSDEQRRDAIALQMTMDLGDRVLVRVASHTTGRTDWLWLERAQQSATWSDLRRALVFNAQMALRQGGVTATSHVATALTDS